jgi:hypothetical protein
MDYYEFYKELYHKENDRRQEVINALNIPLAIITALATVVYILTTTFSYTVHWVASVLFILGILVTVGNLVTAIYHLSQAFVDLSRPYEYTGIPFSKQLFDYRKTLETFVAQNFAGQPDLDKKTDEYFKQYLIENFVEHIDHNTYVNDQKHRFIFNSKRSLIYCLISCLLTLLPFWWGYFCKEDEIHKVEIVHQNQRNHAQPKSAATTAATRTTAATTATATAKQVNQRGTGAAKATQTGGKVENNKPMIHGTQPRNAAATGTTPKSPTATSTPKQGDSARSTNAIPARKKRVSN